MLKARLINIATWIAADSNRAKTLVVIATLALALAGAGSHAAYAGPMPGGSDVH
jgi:hypothetical protein